MQVIVASAAKFENNGGSKNGKNYKQGYLKKTKIFGLKEHPL